MVMFDSKLDSARRITKILIAAALIFAVGACVLYVLAYGSEYEADIHHYATDSVLFRISASFIAAVVLCALLAFILTRKRAALSARYAQAETFAVILTAFMFAAFGVISIGDSSIEPVNKFCSLCIKAVPLLSFISVIPFICASTEKLRGSLLHQLTAPAPVLCGAALTFKYYFDIKIAPLNDPEVVLTLLSLSAWILFTLIEARLSLSIATVELAAPAMILGMIPGIIGAGRIVLNYTSDTLTVTTVMENIMFMTVAVLSVCRAVSLPAKFEPLPEASAEEAEPGSEEKTENEE